MLPNNDFFDQRREWSRWKHELLRRYLPKFAGILGSTHASVGYVDAFAGRGTYNETPPVPGSPLIAAALSAELANSKRWTYSLRCINVEPNAQHYHELRTATDAHPSARVHNLFGPFREQLPEVLKLLGSSPALFLLDPFGHKGMEWDIILRLAQRSRIDKTELLINFYVTRVDRDAGWLDSDGQRAAAAFVDTLNGLYGSDEWQPIIHLNLPQEQRFERLTRLYETRLAKAFVGYVSRYPIRTLEGRLKYHLLHVTTHPRGRREMSDVFYRVHDSYSAEVSRLRADKPQQLSFDDMLDLPTTPIEAEASLVSRLAADIYTVGMQRRQMTFGNLQDAMLDRSWFGQVVERHYRKACKLLIDQGKIEREHGTGINNSTVLRFV